MIKKKYLFSLISLLFIILLIIGSLSIVRGEKDELSKITNLIPNNVKTFLKKTLFVHAELKTKEKEIENQKKIIDIKNSTIKILDYKLNNYFNDYIKSDYFTKTNIEFVKIEKDKIYNNKSFNLKVEKFVSSYLFNGKHQGARATGYLDQYKEKIFLTTGDGMFLFFDLKQLNNEKLNLKKIKSNIKEVIFTDIYNNANDDQYSTTIIGKSIKDLKIIDEELFISFHNEVKRDCFNTSILKAKINFNFLNFERFFVPSECVNKENEYGEFNWFHSGGRITDYKDNLILFTIGEYRFRDLAQNTESIFGKIISIDKNSKDWKIISMGHRNPQGIYYDIKEDYIVSTEHGPNGGDEININLNPDSGNIKNFGWPISSYGYHYDNKFNQKSKAPLHKNHTKYGFEEPIKYYTPSIAISEVVKIPDQFSPGLRNSFFVAAMGSILEEGDLSIHLLDFKDKFSKIESHETIQLGERVRDIVYIKGINKFICYLETTGTIMILSNN